VITLISIGGNHSRRGFEVEPEQRAAVSVHRPDIKEKIFFFIAGLLMSVPFTVVFAQLSDVLCVTLPLFFAQVCSSVLFAPFIEEFAKVFPLFYRHGETERSILNLGILVGLGFGVTEFILYVFTLNASFISRVLGLFFMRQAQELLVMEFPRRSLYSFILLLFRFI
jgi:RsiW-degrading membrane proteinase PrsW (M82 family)